MPPFHKICVCLSGLKKGSHGGNCFTVVLRDVSYREENDVFDSFEELKRGEIWEPTQWGWMWQIVKLGLLWDDLFVK